jgi:hypothetical protein
MSGQDTGALVDWVPIRKDYEAGLMTRNAVADRYSLSLEQLEEHARKNKWVRLHSDITDRRILIFKLMALLERQIDQVGEHMKTEGKREAAVLTSMVRDLDKLIAIEKAEAGQAQRETQSKEMQDLQRKLEKRINAITKG